MKFIPRIKAFFFRLSSREKLLLTAFLLTALLIWASAVLRGVRGSLDSLKISATGIEEQNFWLAEESGINARMDAVLARLKSDKTYTGAELVGRIDEIAREGEALNYEIFSPRTDSDAELNLHSLRFRIRRAGLEDLLNFHQRLIREEPYITLESLRISANKQNPAQLDAAYIVSSPELKSNALNGS